MMKANELRKGKIITYEGQSYVAHSVTLVTRGNLRSYVQAKIKNLKTGNMSDVRFSVDDRLETPFVETRSFEFLYREGDDFVVMDPTSYDQTHVPAAIMGEAEQFLKPNETITCSFIDGTIAGVELPNVVELKVVDTSPVVRGATATNQTKDATMETGYRAKVPPFIEIGETLRIDTRTGEYLERAKS